MTRDHHPGQLRVAIAEDSVLLLAGLTKLLDSAGFEVAATAADADGLLAAVERERPDVVIADVRMPPTHTDEGIRAALVSPKSLCRGAAAEQDHAQQDGDGHDAAAPAHRRP